MQIFSKLIEFLFYPSEVGKLCQAIRDDKVIISDSSRYRNEMGFGYSWDSYVVIRTDWETDDFLKVYINGDVRVSRNRVNRDAKGVRGYGRIAAVGIRRVVGETKKSKKRERDAATNVVKSAVSEMFAEILKG